MRSDQSVAAHHRTLVLPYPRYAVTHFVIKDKGKVHLTLYVACQFAMWQTVLL